MEGEYFLVEVDSLVDYFFHLVKAPNRELELLAHRQEQVLASYFLDLGDCLSVDRESRVNVVEVVHAHEENSSFRQPDNDELVRSLSVWVLYQLVVGLQGLFVFVEVREDLAVELRGLGEALSDAGQVLTQPLSLVVSQLLGLGHLLQVACLLVDVVHTQSSVLQQQEHALNAPDVDDCTHLGGRWRRVDRAAGLSQNWVDDCHRVVVEVDE